MLIGYARVSTEEQNLDLQIDALKKAGCEKIYSDHGVSGKTTDRPELNRALDQLRKGDTLVVWRLDRLGRNLLHLVQTVAGLGDGGVGFVSLNEKIDTSSASGTLVFNVFCSMAQFERDLISERTKAGLESAKARGRKGGRPGITQAQIQTGVALARAGEMPVKQICLQIGISRPTYYERIHPLVSMQST
jgi:DNA invertase Pin-like site-specific DNA recombinase